MSLFNNLKHYFSYFVERFFNQKTSTSNPPLPQGRIEIVHTSIFSQELNRSVELIIYLPFDFQNRPSQQYPALLFNDGQDLPTMKIDEILTKIYKEQKMPPHIVVGIFANENRMQEYGTESVLDYKKRGSQAGHHFRFILQELFPFLEKNYQVNPKDHQHSVAGFSLGGLSALYLAWQYPQKFRRVGVFSGSLWWRHRPFNPQWPDADLIMHHIVSNSSKRPHLNLWFQTGTEDETDDRNNNGIIDSIDDTLLLIKILKSIGYTNDEVVYYEMEGGRHEVGTWAEAMPRFLKNLNIQ